MKKMEPNSIDFIVTDPPYGLNFMNKHWDSAVPNIQIWQEALHICKPGSMLAAFGGSRTHHHLMIALEQAGWEIRDVIMWLYCSGFPKSHNFGRKLDDKWYGYGTALKPAYEPIILAQKSLDNTFTQNAEKWGVAGINIDACRIGINGGVRKIVFTKEKSKGIYGNGICGKSKHESINKGRWPANIIFDEDAKQQLGIVSRFFYCAKASPSERNEGCEWLSKKMTNPNFGSNGFDRPTDQPERETKPAMNYHPTIKPLSLMSYIIKLLAPPGSPVLLDPFCGSGSTLIAAHELGIRAIGIEKEKDYCIIAEKRLEHYQKQLKLKF